MADHPITPPPELVEQWVTMAYQPGPGSLATVLATQAARWGADQRLDAVCKWLDYNYPSVNVGCLRAAMRPKPPSLKELALKALHTSVDLDEFPEQYNTIRRALEALPE